MPRPNFVPYQVVVPMHVARRPSRVITARGGLGALAGNTTTAASGAISGAAAGASVGGPIGAAVGAIGGAIMGILGGQSNPQIQIDKTNAINLFSQYQAVAGTVAGRSIGYENMNLVWRGACFMGHFPSWNNETELPDSAMSMPGSPYGNSGNCFGPLWTAAMTGRAAPGYSDTGNGGVPVKDAKTFVDKYFWPSNSKPDDTNPWATNTDSVGRQVIYDAADAFIATQSSGTTPYIAANWGQAPASTPAPAAPATSGGNQGQLTADGSVVRAGNSTPLKNNQGYVFYFAGSAINGGGDQPIYINGNTYGAAGVLMTLANGGNLYSQNSQGVWWNWVNNGWVQGSAPSAVPTPSAAPTGPGTTLTAGAPGTLQTPFGVLTLTANGSWLLGQTTVGYTSQISSAYAQNGQLIANTVNGGSEYWDTSIGWWHPLTAAGTTTPVAATSPNAVPAPASTPSVTATSTAPVPPPTPTVLESTDGSEVTAPGTALETAGGTMIYFGPQTAGDPNNQYGYPMWESGVQNGYAVGLVMANGGKVYAVNNQGVWYQWGTNNWTQLSGAPSLSTNTVAPPTTSTASSPQSGITSTPSTSTSTAAGSGSVVATTAAGDTVTSGDIAAMASQMAAQNATQQQAYQAILSELQSQGATITSGLQSQVAGQVQSAIPSASSTFAPSGSSSTGLYVVGGALALVAFLMLRKRA